MRGVVVVWVEFLAAALLIVGSTARGPKTYHAGKSDQGNPSIPGPCHGKALAFATTATTTAGGEQLGAQLCKLSLEAAEVAHGGLVLLRSPNLELCEMDACARKSDSGAASENASSRRMRARSGGGP